MPPIAPPPPYPDCGEDPTEDALACRTQAACAGDDLASRILESSDGVILVTIMRSHSADSRLVFEVAEEPKPGQVRVLLDFGGNTELLHLAESITAAELWIAREGYRNARLEIVGTEDGERAGGADLAA